MPFLDEYTSQISPTLSADEDGRFLQEMNLFAYQLDLLSLPPPQKREDFFNLMYNKK